MKLDAKVLDYMVPMDQSIWSHGPWTMDPIELDSRDPK